VAFEKNVLGEQTRMARDDISSAQAAAIVAKTTPTKDESLPAWSNAAR
jgi:hypothetical protein